MSRSNSLALSILMGLVPAVAFAQGNSTAQPQATFGQLLSAGEYPSAIQFAQSAADASQRDELLAQIARSQSRYGGRTAAGYSASAIGSSAIQNQLMNELGPSSQGSQFGGITLDSYQPLMNLIQNTIATDSWNAVGSGEGTMIPFLAGVWIDPSKTLHRIELRTPDPLKIPLDNSGRYLGRSPSAEMQNPIRMLSLVQLEKAVGQLVSAGASIPLELFYLGGLYDIDEVILQESTGDVLLSGRAGPWKFDESGIAVNIATGRPLLRLDDFVACLRAATDNGGRFGCSINPRQKNLAAMQDFLATTKLKGEAWRNKLHQTVGLQDIQVFGIPADSHVARTLVVADHHMKLLGMGIEPVVPEMESFFEQTVAAFNGKPIPMDVARWWFTLGDLRIESSAEHNTFRIHGQLVKVLSETEMINRDGERTHTGKSIGATASFAREFTDHFDEVAERYPIYEELAGVFKLAIVTSLIHQEKLDARAGWNHGCFASAKANSRGIIRSGVAYQLPKYTVPETVQSVMNWKELETTRGGARFRHTIAAVSGGVECNSAVTLEDAGFVSEKMAVLPFHTMPLNSETDWATGNVSIWRNLQ